LVIKKNYLRILVFQENPQVFPRNFLRIFAPIHFPADFGVSGNSADISKVFPADYVTPISCGFYYFRKFRR
jgi:hypothetical protein